MCEQNTPTAKLNEIPVIIDQSENLFVKGPHDSLKQIIRFRFFAVGFSETK